MFTSEMSQMKRQTLKSAVNDVNEVRCRLQAAGCRYMGICAGVLAHVTAISCGPAYKNVTGSSTRSFAQLSIITYHTYKRSTYHTGYHSNTHSINTTPTTYSYRQQCSSTSSICLILSTWYSLGCPLVGSTMMRESTPSTPCYTGRCC